MGKGGSEQQVATSFCRDPGDQGDQGDPGVCSRRLDFVDRRGELVILGRIF